MPASANEKTYALFDKPANKKIVSELERNNRKVFKFPPLETEKTNLDEKSVAAIKNLRDFDWIIFTDVLTVDYFLEVLEENRIDSFETDSAQVCALGEAVADGLRFARLHADVVPTSVDSAKVFLALSDYIGRDNLRDEKFLLVKDTSSAACELEEKLFKCGAEIVNLPVYRTKVLPTNEIAKLKVLLKGGAIDEFVFSAPTDLIFLKNYFSDESVSSALSEINASATDKVVFQTLNEHDIKALYFRQK